MSEATKQKVVWHGTKALRKFLVPIDDLEPFEGNPRRGHVAAVRGSLRRFGQVKPVTVEGRRIVAGHHVRLAAAEEGWTHVAALPAEFNDDDEARAFLLADNRTSDLGSYDLELLAVQLAELADQDALEGTGWAGADVDGLMAELRRRADDVPAPQIRPVSPSGLREVVLLYSEDQARELDGWAKMITRELGLEGAGLSEAVFEGMRRAAQQL